MLISFCRVFCSLEFYRIFQYSVILKHVSFVKVNLPREFIKLSPISSAVIPHKTPDGRLSKTGYVKLLAFSQVLMVGIYLIGNYLEALLQT